jgi:amino acid permease
MHHHFTPSPINGAALNLAVGVFGVSILAMPSAFLGVGVVGGITIITCVGILTIVSIYFLAVAMEALSLYSYEGLSRRLLGPWAVRAARWMLFMFNFGDCVSYLIVAGRLLEPLHTMISRSLAGSSSQWAQWMAVKMDSVADPAVPWTVAYWVFVLLPLSFVRRVTMLQRLSGLAVCALLYIVGAVVYRYWVPLDGGLSITPEFSDPVPLLVALSTSVGGSAGDRVAFVLRVVRGFLSVPVIMFAFDCQALIFQLYTSLEHPHRSVDSMLKVTTRAIVAAWAVYITIGLFGYLTFGDATPDNILRAYDPSQDAVFAAAYAMFLVPATVAFALVLFPVRDVVFEALEDAGLVSQSARLRYVEDDAEEAHTVLSMISEDVTQSGSRSADELDGTMGVMEEDARCSEVDDELDVACAAPSDCVKNVMTTLQTSTDERWAMRHERPMLVSREDEEAVRLGNIIFKTVSAILSLLCLVTAIVAPRLDIVFGLLGGLCSSSLCFLFPAAYRLQMAQEMLLPLRSRWMRLLAWVMVVVGVFGAIFGTAAGVVEFIQQAGA